MNRRFPTRALLTAACCAALAASIHAAPSPTGSAGTESLGNQLLDDLNPQLFAPPATPPDAPPPDAEPAHADFSKRILPDHPGLGGGDAQASANAPLARVERNMRTAGALLMKPETADRADDMQRNVVSDLDALIEQLSKQCQCCGSCSGNCNKPGDKPKAAGAKPGKSGRGGAPARDSTTRIGKNDPQAVKLGDHEALIKDLWGQLPAHAREQLMQTYSDEFLPQYELEIEKYFQRLSEEQGGAK